MGSKRFAGWWCWVCGARFSATREDATWCGARCRQIACRLRKRLGRPPSRAEQEAEWALLQARHRGREEMRKLVADIRAAGKPQV